MSGELKVLEGHSPVNKYELLSLEQSAQGLTEERMVLAFQALDELIPHLGVYTRVFHKLREDFFEAVYSDELTGSGGGEDESEAAYIQRLPYFVLVQRVYKERHQQSEELKEQLDIVKERLFDKHRQFEDSQTQVQELENAVANLEQNATDLNDTIAEKDLAIASLERQLETTRTEAGIIQEKLNQDVNTLEKTLMDTQIEVEYLTRFKTGYDDLYEAFQDKEDDEDEPLPKKKAVISTKRANLISNIECCNRLEEQILTVVNTTVEEFDKFLEDHKSELEAHVTTEDMTEAEYEIQEMEIDDADQQLEGVQERFRVTIGEMMTELGLLRQHGTMLMEQLQTLEENKPDPPVIKKKQSKAAKLGVGLEPGDKRDSILSAGLSNTDMEDAVADPFIPQERVFSKYAAMVYTSNNSGKTFEEFKEAKYCPSCGEKTVICPHRLGGSERVFILPHNCTHLKITRPKVRINRDLIDDIMKPPTPDLSNLDMTLPPSASDQMQDSIATPTGPQTPGVSRGATSSMGGPETTMVTTMQAVWDDYQQRTLLERTVPRPLDHVRTTSLMEQFLAFIMWQDDYGEDEEGYFSILDNLYRFLTERYIVEDVIFFAAHDFITSISEYSSTDKMLQLLGTVLSGNLDASCLRYTLLLCDFVQSVDWKEVEDFRAFASAVYPFLGEDDLETLQMSYQSFSENRVSKQIVTNFLIHIILKYREPRFHELENRLVPFQATESGHLTEREFKDALENILPLSNDRLRKRLFAEAEHTVMLDDGDRVTAVPIMRLAQISGYLALYQITPIVKENVVTRVAQWRDRPSSAGSTKPSDTHAASPTDIQAVSMSRVKTLAANISRRQKHRKERLLAEEEADEEGW